MGHGKSSLHGLESTLYEESRPILLMLMPWTADFVTVDELPSVMDRRPEEDKGMIDR